MADMTAADIIAERLYAAGCRYAFGVPGGEVIAMIEALRKVGIRFILAKHENAAGFMAEGVWQRSGAPGILVATLGPGLANGVNVIANAHQDRVPLIVLTGCVDAGEALTYSHQVFDHQALLAPITKASFRLADGAVDVLADKVLDIALSERPGPVHIDLPITLTQSVQPAPGPIRRQPAAAMVPYGPDLARARQWLAEAERPIALVGLDVLNQGGVGPVRRFLEHQAIPTLTTYKAKGVLPEDHALALGGAGLSPTADGHLLPLVRQADLVLLLGYDPIEMRSGWRQVWDVAAQRVIDLNSEAMAHGMHDAGLRFTGDVGASLAVLGDGIERRASWPDGEPAAVQQALAGAFGQDEAWGPAAIVTTTRAHTPRDTLLTIDSGAHRILASQVWPAFEARSVLQSTGLCTMGCALPLAIGAKLADPARPVVVFTGDAGLEMTLGELATVRDLGLPLVIVVFADASLALIELKQRQRQLANCGVDFAPSDFAAIGRALGGHGVEVRTRDELASALEAALAADRFTLISAIFDRRAYDGRL